MKNVIMLFAMLCGSRVALAENIINVGRIDFDGSLKLIGLQVINGRYAWSVIASSDRWAEVDLGLNLLYRQWVIQPMIGVDFAQNDVGHVECGSILAQLYLIRYGRMHEEAWYVGIVPVHEGTVFHTLRQIVSHRPRGSPVWIGGQYDLAIGHGLKPDHFVGPLVERNLSSTGRIALTVQWNSAGQSRFQLTYILASIPLF